MLVYLTVALGSALGGAARYGLTRLVTLRVGKHFPWGTLLVNISGCFAIGLFGASALPSGDALAQVFFTTGLLGGYTTFSSFSLETLYLARQGRPAAALAYLAASLGACLAGTAAGVLTGTLLTS